MCPLLLLPAPPVTYPPDCRMDPQRFTSVLLPHSSALTCTLRHLLSICLSPSCRRMDPQAFQLSPACQEELKATRMKKRVHDILSKALAEKREG